MEIVEFNEESLNKIPNVFKFIYDKFGSNHFSLYQCFNDDELCFVAFNGIDGMYIDNIGYRMFKVDLDNNLKMFSNHSYEVYFNGGSSISFVDKDNNEYSLRFEQLDEPDSEEYNGEVVFTQYHPKDDTFCQLSYQHMYYEYNGNPSIYSYHTKKPNQVFIEENSSSNHEKRFGLAGKHIKNFARYTFDRDMIGFNLVMINENGLLRTLLSNSYELEREDTIKRFVKCPIIFNDEYYSLWPFVNFYSEDDIKNVILNYGFVSEIPEEMLTIYNNRDEWLQKINLFLEQLKQGKEKEAIRLQILPDHK